MIYDPRTNDRMSNNSVGSKVSPVKTVNFMRDCSSIKAVAIDGSSQTVQISVDVSNLKLFAILMCKGPIRDKAQVFYEVVIGMEKVKKEKM